MEKSTDIDKGSADNTGRKLIPMLLIVLLTAALFLTVAWSYMTAPLFYFYLGAGSMLALFYLFSCAEAAPPD